MVRFRGSARLSAVAAGALAALAVLAAGCGTGHAGGGPAGQPRLRAAASPGTGRPAATGKATAGKATTGKATGYVKRADFLTGVTCLATGTCVAVGWYYYGAAGPGLPLAVRWNGTSWLPVPAPGRGRGDLLDSVSCATASSCLAVGGLAEAWAGTRWSIVPGPPGGPMSSVSCPAPGSCQAVGLPPSGTRPVAARWDGRTWQAEPVPRPAPVPQNLTLAAISCATPRFCMAVGDASRGAKARPSPSYRDSTLAERWNGSRWRILPTPNPSHASEFSGVSCPAPTACVAVGSSAGGARTLAERWNGNRWTVQRTPDIGHIGYSALTAVSCATVADCTAVGTYNAGASGIAEHWDGARWTIQRLPAPPGQPGEDPLVLPASVSCTPAACTMVGTTQNKTLAERRTGGRWIIEPTPNPA